MQLWWVFMTHQVLRYVPISAPGIFFFFFFFSFSSFFVAVVKCFDECDSCEPSAQTREPVFGCFIFTSVSSRRTTDNSTSSPGASLMPSSYLHGLSETQNFVFPPPEPADLHPGGVRGFPGDGLVHYSLRRSGRQ